MQEYRGLDEAASALRDVLDAGEKIVFFGGAGVSTESGIPDFRSVDGLYSLSYDYPPETILSRSFADREPEPFFDFYRDRTIAPEAQPNAAHTGLMELERRGKSVTIITQNIDGLHTRAGSSDVIELHGCVDRNICTSCGYVMDAREMKATTGVPVCPGCGGRIRPDVVLYEDPLDELAIFSAIRSLREADTLIVAGTSLVVYPAAGLIDYFAGERLVVVNRNMTSRDRFADIVIRTPIAATFARALGTS